ncbi:gephyrin-like molybdotransferase Glp [Dokdonia sp.]|uniref:molybdopterin molybdotransferase MoeA n=1 Tax=Dokdonia sp. TaxID=2024995 RepID=UPI0032650CC0
MIDVKTARDLVLLHSAKPSEVLEVIIKDALDFVLAEDVISKIEMPPYRQSAMDGYAINGFDDTPYTVVGEIKAGDDDNPNLNIGDAVRIFTGAPVPDTANTVIMQEKVIVHGSKIILEESIQPNKNIRPKGEQIKIGDLALAKGTTIKGAHVGFLASLGITKIQVYKKPSIAIVVTGNELVNPGDVLPYGKVYESNGSMLTAVLSELGYKNTSVVTVEDDYEKTKKALNDVIQNYDVVIVTGGVSVGDYDFVGRALKDIGVEEIFYKVKQKPGKPLFFGKKDQVSIFGLPGNPAAALSCFYVYVYPLLKKSEGACNTSFPNVLMPLLTDYTVKGDRAQFLKARMQNDGVEILDGQSSAMIRAFGDANALVFLPENTKQVHKGQNVKTILLSVK